MKFGNLAGLLLMPSSKRSKTMKSKMILKASVSVVAMMVAFCGWASPWTLPAKAVVEAAEKVGAHAGGHAAGEVAVRGGAALAEATAKREVAKAVACTAAGKVVEKATVSTVVSLLGKAAARQAGTMAAGAGAAIADGPLPIGDIVGGVAVVGCTLWTWWDINKATNVLPEKLAETLNGVTRDCEKKSREEMLRLGEEVVARAL
jgi:hypothetical protein